jgi:inhibitor of KinA sporulation pathway (predicted exonuclease)
MRASSQVGISRAVVFDLEFTAWDGSQDTGWMRPGEYRELIQIGAVKVDGGFRSIAEFDCLIRPRLNPTLSHYIEQLTGITNDELRARGVDISDAYGAFVTFAGDLPILAFGRDDLVISENLRLYGLKNMPALPPFQNLRHWLEEQGIDTRGFRACNVGPAAGVPFDGHIHNGLADARSVAAGVAALMARGASSPLRQ